MKDARLSALVKLGWVKIIDVFFFIMVITPMIFASIQAVKQAWISCLIFLMISALFSMSWGIVLLFRCMYFVIKLSADVNLMPEAAAKIVAVMMRQQQQ
jgi:hypothetical protein